MIGAAARVIWRHLSTIAALLGLAGCDATVTPIGAWLPEASTGFYLEAEEGQLSGGFTVATDASASAGHCLAPPANVTSLDQPGSAEARYAVTILTPGTYVIWGRVHSPDTGHNTFWFKVDTASWYLWRITTGEEWYWDPLHDNRDYGAPLRFELDAGQHALRMANAGDGNQLDRLYFTADGDAPPGNDTHCNPPHSVQLDGGCVPSCGSQGGDQCGAMACSGRVILPAYDCDICCMGQP